MVPCVMLGWSEDRNRDREVEFIEEFSLSGLTEQTQCTSQQPCQAAIINTHFTGIIFHFANSYSVKVTGPRSHKAVNDKIRNEVFLLQ